MCCLELILNGWGQGDQAQVFGLFAVITILTLTALGLRRRYHSENEEARNKVLDWSNPLLTVASLYTIGYLWYLSHSILTGEKAVSLAPFVHALAGLFSYINMAIKLEKLSYVELGNFC